MKINHYLLIIAFLLIACIDRKKSDDLNKALSKVTNTYVDADDSAFSKKQDTLYYEGKYFSGHLFHLYPGKDTAFNISFLNGVQEGFTRKWYANKQLAEERLYIKGQKEGVHKAWWEDGKPKFIFDITADVYSGELKEWYSSGQLGKWFHYKNGQEEGSQKLWWADGRLRANYVVKHGKKYGSIGIKLCLNPNDSIYKK